MRIPYKSKDHRREHFFLTMVGTNLDNGDLLQGLNVLVNVLPQPGDAETNPLSFAILAEKVKEILVCFHRLKPLRTDPSG
jgi:hypothetical protein